MSHARSKARHCALQALYQWQLAGQGPEVVDIENQFFAAGALKGVDKNYFCGLLHEVAAHVAEIDGHLGTCLDRPVRELDPVERAILRIGAWELAARPEIPYRVVINEAVEAAKLFGAEQSHRYVNGVLDRLAVRLRPLERGG
ncbi:MAG TPA: transcription antitermination factor NusB [Gammaproteobacteria bacterium]|nr:transcription antitermination factor NusB [Gammaproteobacteria bacterium]